MLELKNITKSYSTGDFNQVALNDVSISFREKEFVSILGPSGSGKTTMLNIIGGLDKYDSGDLIINGISTKEYKDRDWDTYRNHSIGFVFQSYNLISHQSVLSNVEMALTLSGVSSKERKQRAIDALKRVGLEDHIHKKPNQLSGGQMQRVAIARALVNNPDIILADEPTGALDTDTSSQIMAILKEISNDKLVVMVTHNPELAEEYSTRIIKVRDGKVIDDSDPFAPEPDKQGEKPKKKTSMNFWTALTLSFNNLLTKKGRTILTAFAGSIGIIGIALILAISTGVQNYIDDVQRDTLSSFPIQIEKESTDISALMQSLLGVSTTVDPEDTEERDAVYGNPIMYQMMKSMMTAEVKTNNLKKLKQYFDKHKDELSQYATAIQYGYNIDLHIYATDPNGEYAKADFLDLMQSAIDGGSMVNTMTSMMSSVGGINIWQELIADPTTGEVSDLVKDQYQLVHGKWPTEANEIVLVLTEHNEISDITLYALGLVDKQTMIDATLAAMTGKENNGWDEYIGKSWSYEEICDIQLKMVLPTDYYQYDENTKLWVNISNNQSMMDRVIDKGMDLKIVGIIKPSKDAAAAFLTGSLCYTHELTEYYIEQVNSSKIMQAQLANYNKNIITGLPFHIDEDKQLKDSEKAQAFLEYVAELTDSEKAKLYEAILATPNEEFVQSTIDAMLSTYEGKTVDEIVDEIASQYAKELGYSEDLIRDMLSSYSKDELMELLETTVREMVVAKYKEDAKKTIEAIHSYPSDEEMATLKEMIQTEMYSPIAHLAPEVQYLLRKPIDIAFVAQYWSATTGMSSEAASLYLGGLLPNDFYAIFDRVLTETAVEAYKSYGGMSSNADNDRKVAKVLDEYLANTTDDDMVYFYENHMPDKISEQSHWEVVRSLGYATIEDPSFIYIYPIDFEMKDNISAMIDEYNMNASEDDKIEYTDIAAMLMSSVSDIITAISVVLICFVSISLVVSSIMIGIITYISVLERTKEIGILRAVGASKRDISRVFNAETFIVGLLAGLVGILTTVLLCFPISWIARSVTGITSLTAILPWYGYFLILLSVGLTLLAGLLPSSMAAKKDPVIALRTE